MIAALPIVPDAAAIGVQAASSATGGLNAVLLGRAAGAGLTIPDNSFYTIKNLAPVTTGTPLAYTADGQIGPQEATVQTRSATFSYQGDPYTPAPADKNWFHTDFGSLPTPAVVQFTLSKPRTVTFTYTAHFDTNVELNFESNIHTLMNIIDGLSVLLRVDGTGYTGSVTSSDLVGPGLTTGHNVASTILVDLPAGSHTAELIYAAGLRHSNAFPDFPAGLGFFRGYGPVQLVASWISMSTEKGETGNRQEPNSSVSVVNW